MLIRQWLADCWRSYALQKTRRAARQQRVRTIPALAVRPLEIRQVLNAAPVPVQPQANPAPPPAAPAVVVVDAGALQNNGTADVFKVTGNQSQVQVFANDVLVQSFAANSQTLQIQGSADADSLVIDFSQGNPLSGLSVQFAGSQEDSVTLAGGSAGAVGYQLGQDGTTQISVDGSSISLSSGVSVTDHLAAGQRTVHADGQVVLSDAVGEGDELLTTDRGQSVTFTNPSQSFTVDVTDADGSADDVRVESVDAVWSADLSIVGDSADHISLTGWGDLHAGDLTATAGRISVDGDWSVSGSNISLTATEELTVTSTGSLTSAGGFISLDGGANGVLSVSGRIDVTSNNVGGTIHLLGSDVLVLGDAALLASGDFGGGTILVGGDAHGANADVRNASRTYVGRNALLAADGLVDGNGGKVVVWADDTTVFKGTITARGGSHTGNGGWVETSGKTFLAFSGFVDTSAPNGQSGTLLLDPQDITIVAGAAASGAHDGELNEGTPDRDILFADGGGATDFTISNGTLETLTSNVTLEAQRDILVQTSINFAQLGSGESVTFRAGRHFTSTGVTITTAGAAVVIEADSATSPVGGGDLDGDLATGAITTAGGDLTLSGLSVTANGAINTGAGNLNITTSAGAILANSTVTVGGTATLSASAGSDDITLSNTSNALANVVATGDDVSLADSDGFTIGNISGATSVTLKSDGAITQNALTAISGGLLTKQGTGTLTLSQTNLYTGDTKIDAGTVSISASTQLGAVGNVNLNGGTLQATSSFVNTGTLTFSANSTVQVDSAVTLTQSGTLNGSSSLVKSGAGTLALTANNSASYSGTISITGGTLSAAASNNLGDSSAGNDLALSNGAVFEATGSFATTRDVTLGSGGGTIQVDPTFALTLNSAITESGGAQALTKTGSGTLVLGAANTYTGATNINAGTVQLSGSGRLSDSTAVVLADVAGAILDLNGISDTIGSLAGGGTNGGNVTLGAATLTAGGDNSSTTYSGVISGILGGLTKAGSGVLTLAHANSYTGATNVNAGTLAVTANDALGTTVVATTVASGATLDFQNVAYSSAEAVSLGGGTIATSTGTSSFAGAVTMTANSVFDVDGAQLTLSGAVGGAQNLTKTGAGILVLSNLSNGYSGTTTISAGTLSLAPLLASTNNISSSTAIDVQSSGTLLVTGLTSSTIVLASGQSLNVNGTVTGAVDVNNQTLTGSGSISGAVTADGTSTVAPGTDGTAGQLSTGSIDFSAGNSDASFKIDIGGTTAGTNYDQLKVTGSVTLGSNDVTLTLNRINTFTPVAGDSFIIIDNDGTSPAMGDASGTFQGMADNSKITDFLGITGLTATISYSGGDGNDVEITVDGAMTFNAVGTTITLTVSDNGQKATVTDGTNSKTVTLSSTDLITINGTGGNDTLTINFTNGNPLDTTDIAFHGGAGSDSMILTGGTFTTGVYTSSSAGAGTIQYDGGTNLITFDGLEPVFDDNTVTDYTINTTAGDDAITIENDALSRTLVSEAADLFEAIGFKNKTNVTVNSLGGNDTIALADNSAPATGLSSLTVDAGLGATDAINLTGAFTLASGTLSLTAETISQTAGAVSLTTLNLTGAVVQSGGSYTVSGTTTVVAGAAAIDLDQSNNFGTIALSNTGANNITVVDTNALILGNVSMTAAAAGALSLTSVGLSQAAATTITTGAGAITIGAGAGAITLANTGNDFNGVLALTNTGANNITIVDTDDVVLGTVSMSAASAGQLSVTAVGISQNGATTITTGTGNVAFDGGAGAIALGNANDFSGGVALTNTGANNITVVDVDDLVLRTVSMSAAAAGQLSLTSVGLSQSGVTTITTGTGDVTVSAGAGAIALGNSNDFNGALSLTNTGANNITVLDTDNLVLGTVSMTAAAAGALSLTSVGLSQNGATTITTGTGTVTVAGGAGAIALGNNNDFNGTVGLSNTGANNITILDVNFLDLGAVSMTAAAAGGFTATSAAGMTLNAAVTTGTGGLMADADSDADGTGTFTLAAAGSIVAGSGAVSITAADVVFTAGSSLSGSSTLLLRPSQAAASIGIGGGAGTFNLSDTDLTALANGFSLITIGRAADGTGAVDIDDSTFLDPLTVVGGSISVTGLDDTGNAVTLTARTTAISDGGDVSASDVTGTTLTFTAETGIGLSGPMEISGNSISATTTNGGIDLTNAATAGTTAGTLTTGTGSITFSQTGGQTLSVTTASTTDGAISISNTGANLTVGTITAGGAGNNVTLTTVTSGDILLGLVTAVGDRVTVTAAGAITDNNAGTNNIDATQAILIGPTGIGASGNAIETTVSQLDFNNATSGGVFVANTGALTLIDLNLSAATAVGGAISAASPLTISMSINILADMSFTAGNDNTADDDDLTVDSAAVLTLNSAAALALTLNAGDDIIFNTGTVAVAGGGTAFTVNLNADLDGVGVGDTDRGSVTQVTNIDTIVADTLNITAGDGIGSSGQAFRFNTDVLSTDSSGNNGDQFLREVDSVQIVTMTAGTGDITLTAGTGSITDNAADATTDITGDAITLTAVTGVGETAGNGTLDTAANSLDVSVTAAGIININEADAVTLTDVDTADGSITIVAGAGITATDVQSTTDSDADDISLTATTGDVTVGTVIVGAAAPADAALGDVTIVATAGSILDDASDAVTDVRGEVVTLTAATGIGAAAGNGSLDLRAVSLDASVTGTGIINLSETNGITLTDVDTADGSITIQAGGAIVATDVQSSTDADANDIGITADTGNITVGLVIVGASGAIDAAAGDVSLTATAGSIVDDASDATTDVRGDVVTLTAASGIGETAGNGSLDLRAVSLDASVTAAGVINLTETNAITLTDVDTADGSITLVAGADITATDVQSTTDSDANDIGLTATTGNILTGSIVVGAAAPADAALGDITLLATAGSILDDASDATTDIRGQVVTLTAATGIGATAGNGSVDLRAESLDASVTAAGLINLTEFNAITLTDVDTADGSITLLAGGAVVATDVQSTTDADANDIAITATTGDITVGTVIEGAAGSFDAAAGDIGLTATAGSILDDANDATTDVRGEVVTLTAAAGIGATAGNGSLDLRAVSLDASVTAAGLINLNEFNAITLTDVDTADGSIALVAGATITATDVQSTTDADANDIGLTATTGDIMAGSVIVGATAPTDAVLGDVTLLAGVGSILDDASDGTTDVRGDFVVLTALNGIGATAGNGSLDLRAVSLDASVTGAGVMNVTETNAIDLFNVDTANGSIDLVAGGTIAGTDVQSMTDADANDITLTATGGDIGAIFIRVGSGVTDALSGDVTLAATTGTIFDLADDTVQDVIGEVVTLTAANGLGEAADALDLFAVSLDASVTGGGNLNLTEVNGITLTDVDTANGSIDFTGGGAVLAMDVQSTTDSNANGIDLTALSGNITVGTIVVGTAADAVSGDVTLAASAGSIVDDASDATADLRGDVLTLSSMNGIGESAGNGAIDLQANALEAHVTAAGVINFVEANAISLTSVDTASGTITGTAGSDVGVGVVNSGAAATTLTSSGGNLTDLNSDTGADVIASTATLSAMTGIGTSGQTLDVNATTQSAAVNGTGGLFLNANPNGGAVTVTSATTTAGNVVIEGTTTATRTLQTVTAMGSLTVNNQGSSTLQTVTSAGTSTVTTSANATVQSLTSGGTATVNAGGAGNYQNVTATSGSLNVTSGGNMTVANLTINDATGEVIVTAGGTINPNVNIVTNRMGDDNQIGVVQKIFPDQSRTLDAQAALLLQNFNLFALLEFPESIQVPGTGEIRVLLGQPGESGFVVGHVENGQFVAGDIDWDDLSSILTNKQQLPSLGGFTQFLYSHLYGPESQSSQNGIVEVSMTIRINPAVTITAGGQGFNEQTLTVRINASLGIFNPAAIRSVEAPPVLAPAATVTPLLALSQVVVQSTQQTSAGQQAQAAGGGTKYLVFRVPADGSMPVQVRDVNRKALRGGQLADIFAGLPDGRYRLVIRRGEGSNRDLQVMEVLIRDGKVINLQEEDLERLRQLRQSGELDEMSRIGTPAGRNVATVTVERLSDEIQETESTETAGGAGTGAGQDVPDTRLSRETSAPVSWRKARAEAFRDLPEGTFRASSRLARKLIVAERN